MYSPHAITHPAFRPSIMGKNGVVFARRRDTISLLKQVFRL